jgi:hypothetical protein
MPAVGQSMFKDTNVAHEIFDLTVARYFYHVRILRIMKKSNIKIVKLYTFYNHLLGKYSFEV